MKENETVNQSDPELPKNPEKYAIYFGGLTISGRSGTGKTKLAEDLQRELNVPHFYKTGELFRQIIEEQLGEEVIGYQERNLNLDRELDTKQRQLLKNASAANPLILEGRLAGFITNQLRNEAEMDQNEKPNIVTILLTAKSEERYRRILKRQRLQDPSLTFHKIQKLTREREKTDRVQWEKLHPELEGIDIFNPANKLANGEPMYDLIVNTNHQTTRKVLQEVLTELKKRGLIKEISRESEEIKIPEFGHIFP